MNEDWHLRWVRIPEGTHLSNSKDTPGAERCILREDGTNKFLGPTESVPVDEDAIFRVCACETHSPRYADVRELSPVQRAIVEAIADRAVEGLERVAREVVVPAFKKTVAPAVKRKWSGITKSLRSATREASGQAGTIEISIPTVTPPADAFKEVAAVDEPKIIMSSAEFQQRLFWARAAEKFAAEQKGILCNARVEGDDLPPELKSAIELVIEGNASLLDEETRAAVMKFLTGARDEGEYVLPSSEETQ